MQIRKLAPGDRLLDYRILEKIGEGGFGEVFRAEHEVLGRIVALKVPRDHESLSALRLEGVIQSTLDHPAIVKTLEISISHDPPYVVMEHVDGMSLAEMLKREGPLSWKRAARVLLEAGRALKHAHERGVVHGDVKPGNVLVEPGDEGRIRLTDFGLGRVFEGPRGNVQISRSLELATSGAEVQGTLRYLAPEVQRGEQADERSDIYSWGVLLFEAVTGKLPEGREIPSDLAKYVPWELDSVFESCFQRRERRPRNLDAPLAVLERLVTAGSQPREAGGEDARASRAIPCRGHDASVLVKPLSAGPSAVVAAKAIIQGGPIVTPDATVPPPVPPQGLSPPNPEVLRLLEDLRKIREGKASGAANASLLGAELPQSAGAVPPADFVGANAIRVGAPLSPLDLGAASRVARSDRAFARWREAFLGTLKSHFEKRPAGSALLPGEGFDLACGVTTEGDPQHRIYAAVLPYVDLDTARRFVRAARAVFEREKGVWEKEVTFAILSREVREKEQVLWTLRSFSTGWWRRRRVVLQDLTHDKLYATELGCDPRGNALKRIFFDAVRVAATRTQAPAVARSCHRRECVRGSLVGVGLALVATACLLGGAVSFERAQLNAKRRCGFHQTTMRATPGSLPAAAVGSKDGATAVVSTEPAQARVLYEVLRRAQEAKKAAASGKDAAPVAPATAAVPAAAPAAAPTPAPEVERNPWWDADAPDEPAPAPQPAKVPRTYR